MNCLLCGCDCPDPDVCATRHTDGALVCPACTAKVRRGDRDALDKLYDAAPVKS